MRLIVVVIPFAVLACFGECSDEFRTVDLDENRVVDFRDFAVVASEWAPETDTSTLYPSGVPV